MKLSDFVFDYVQLLYCKCHKINANLGGSYVDFPNWIKNEKSTRNPTIKTDNEYFPYPVTILLNHEEIKKYLQRLTKVNIARKD